MTAALIERFRAARQDPELVVLEGFHALKHALRFGAEVIEVAATDITPLKEQAEQLAPELSGSLEAMVDVVADDVLAQLARPGRRADVIALARRPPVDLAAALSNPRPAPVVLLEDPRDLGNIGACIRVAAAANAAAVLTTGSADPWHADAIRGGAALQFALPVARVGAPPSSDRLLVAVDPEGDDLRPAELPARAVLAFGTERHGLSDALLHRAGLRIRVPMQDGVSSLNLATAVSAVLFSWRLAQP